MKIISTFFFLLICIQNNNEIEQVNPNCQIENTQAMKLKITIGKDTFTATLLDNETAVAFKALLPMTITMTELNGNEKYYDLPKKIPTKSSNPGTIQNGDLMIYGSNTLVLFYKSFSTTYSYTMIGSIDDPTGLSEVLGSSGVTVTLESN